MTKRVFKQITQTVDTKGNPVIVLRWGSKNWAQGLTLKEFHELIQIMLYQYKILKERVHESTGRK